MGTLPVPSRTETATLSMSPGTPGYPIHATQNSWLPYPCHMELLTTLHVIQETPGYPIHATQNSWLPYPCHMELLTTLHVIQDM